MVILCIRKNQVLRAIKIAPVKKTVSKIKLTINPNRSLDELYRLIG